jgi:protoporphyrinogen oxidase
VLQGRAHPFDVIVSTTPLPVSVKLLEDTPRSYVEKLAAIDYLGVVCMLLKLKRPLTDSFWVNVNDPRIIFNGLIEYSNLNPCEQYNGSRIVYIPYYLPGSEPRFGYSDEQLLAEYAGLLRLINPQFADDWIEEFAVFRDRYAQPVCTTNFARAVPPIQTPVRNLYLLDSTQIYPSDRTISGMIGLAEKACELIVREQRE